MDEIEVWLKEAGEEWKARAPFYADEVNIAEVRKLFTLVRVYREANQTYLKIHGIPLEPACTAEQKAKEIIK